MRHPSSYPAGSGCLPVHHGSLRIHASDVVYVSILGDVNGDGFITSLDTVSINNYLKGQERFVNEFYLAADINKDGSVTKIDYTTLYKHVLGREDIESGLK